MAEIAAGTDAIGFDLTGDGMVDGDDLGAWLVEGGAMNPAQTDGNPFLLGDANLDGSVDGTDFGIWNRHKFTSENDWTKGNFVPDTVVDGRDLLAWNGTKFTSSAGTSAVPEPASGLGLWFVGLAVALLKRR